MHNVSPAVQPVALETFGGLVTLASPDSLPEGASPRCFDNDYLVGETFTRDGLTSAYSYAGASAGPDAGSVAVNSAITGNAWANPAHILSSTYTTCTPGAGSDALNITAFAFAMPSTITPTGAQVVISGFATSDVTLSVQLLLMGSPVGVAKTFTMPLSQGSVTVGSLSDLWGAAPDYSSFNQATFGLQITASTAFPLAQVSLNGATLQVGQTTGNANFNFIGTFTAQNGDVKNLSLDANGNFWVENVTANPGVLTVAIEGITAGSYANGVNGPDVEFLAFNDLTTGSDVPRQYTPGWTDRISQVGPGAGPVFSAVVDTGNSYAITSITQPAPHNRGSSYFLQSVGPGLTSPGNVVTVYYSDSTVAGPDADLVAAFNSGNPTYVFTSFTGTAITTQGPYTVLVTAVGQGTPPGQPRSFYYFTYVLSTSVYTFFAGSGHPSYTANYQRTLAEMITAVPVPLLTVGSQATVTGASVPAWDSTWTISQTLNSGAMAITQTSLTAGVATYSYTVVSGANPVAGQLVKITGTLNANGTLNGPNLTIAGVTGGSSGTFTITGFSAVTNYLAEAETGAGTTAGTDFAFDPGVGLLGSSTSPIFGNSTGGALVFAGSGQYIGPGTRQGVYGWITRNGYWSPPSPPVTFSCPSNTTAIAASQVGVGPPNVIARYFAFTEAGSNGVPGANFFTLPVPVQYIVQNITYTASSTLLNDNTSTTASFSFPDTALLQAEAIDVQGNNLFNLLEIGNPGWIASYAYRNFYGLCQNKIQNFLNLSFDGGYLPGVQKIPLGWSVPDIYGMLLASPVFGNSYYIQNTTVGALATAGLISQSAFHDAYSVPILNVNTAYSVRVTARIPSSLTTGSLVVDLVTSAGISYGSFTLPFASMTSSMAIYTGTLLTAEFATVPSDLLLRVYASGIGAGADVEIDRVEPFDTAIPVLNTTVYSSYVNKPEAVDGLNQLIANSENPQPVTGARVMYDALYLLKGSSLYSTRTTGNLEPANWPVNEVSQKAGSVGINSHDSGEQWIVMAARNGVFLFSGGQPGKISQEIFQIWDAINWTAGNSIWVRNDVVGRRLFIGIPLPTPNFWLPDAAANAAPTNPNVILMLNYQGMDTVDEIKGMPQMHTTMFGSLNAIDMRRKWSLWQIPSPYAAFVTADVNGTMDEPFYICNGRGNSKIYRLDSSADKDDGTDINSLYTTYGFTDAAKAAQSPMLGFFRKRWKYGTITMDNTQTVNVKLLPNQLIGPADTTTGYNPWSVPGGFPAKHAYQDREFTCNFSAQRTFVEFSTSGAMRISRLIMLGAKDVWNQLTGVK